jgi:hypothetical protein
MSTQQTINREVYSLVAAIKDDLRNAVVNFAKTTETVSQEDAIKLTNLLLASVDGAMIKAHPNFDKKLVNLLKK